MKCDDDWPCGDEVVPVGENDLRQQLVGRRVDNVRRERVNAVGHRCSEAVRQHIGAGGTSRAVQHEVERVDRRLWWGGVHQGQLGDWCHVERVRQELNKIITTRRDDWVFWRRVPVFVL